MRRVFLVLVAVGMAFWLHRRGVFPEVPTTVVVGWAAGLAVVCALLGVLIGAGHARERRAWSDYQERRAAVPVARRLWFGALAESLRRMALPALVVAALLALFWKGRS